MSASMALASGVLLFSSLSVLFPQAQNRLDNNALLYTCFFIGATVTALLTRFIHYLMPDAIHACGKKKHDENDEERQKLITHTHNEYAATAHFQYHDHDHPPISIKENHQYSGGSYYSIGIQTAIAICIHKFPGKRKALLCLYN